ncbi:MAG: DUF4255 domain-containing protein [Pseudomonadota bacterium]
MIDLTLKFLLAELNTHLRTRFSGSDDLAVLEQISRDPGNPGEKIENRLVLTLINIEREPIAANTARIHRQVGDDILKVPQPLNLNLILMLASHFPENYSDSLKVLSAAIGFFQSHPLFTRQSSPGLPDPISRLSVEWHDLDLQAIHNLWTVLGGQYVPSAVYKARMLVLDEDLAGVEVPVITGAQVES